MSLMAMVVPDFVQYVEADALDIVDYLGCAVATQALVGIGYQRFEGLLVHHLVAESHLLAAGPH